MSDLIRYNIKPGEDGYEIAVSLGGEWVHYSDYARLQQERVHDLNQIGGLQQELASLKAEVERLKEGNDCLDKMHEKEMERSAYLCEEFNRTTAWGRGLESDLSHARVEISFLKAEVERLTKAGDAVCESPYLWEDDPAVIAWRAAKEGKPSV